METLLLCPFKYFFLRFVLTCATVKSVMFYRFAFHHVQPFFTFFITNLEVIILLLNIKKNRHAICLSFDGCARVHK